MASSSPSKPYLTDEYEPSDPELWERVLLVAKGRLREYTTRNRTIHSPNNGLGFRHWPNPRAIAWAVKQYNGFEGGWHKRKEANHRIADRVVTRYRLRSRSAAAIRAL